MLKEKIQKYRAFARRVNEWQRREPPTVEIDPTVKTCANCGCEHDGRFCPQCGMPANRKRLTVKNVILNFLDIWGFGSRPMFRTIGQLFTRPGYLIRDYLNGHYLRFFPPFKMLVVLTLLFVVECHIIGLDPTTHIDTSRIDTTKNSLEEQKIVIGIVDIFNAGGDFLNTNPTASVILIYVFFIFAARITFRKKRLNLSETFIAHIYIACQMQVLEIIQTLVTLRLSSGAFLPHHLSEFIMYPMLVYDYHQLYDIKWWKSIWRTLVSITLAGVFYMLLIVLLSIGIGIYLSAHGIL